MKRALLLRWFASVMRCLSFATFLGCSFAEDAGHQIAEDLRLGKNAEAQKLIGEALRQSPQDARLWTLNGIAQAQAADKHGALRSFLRALQYAPDYVPALESAARIEYEEKDPAARTHLEKLTQLRPQDTEAQYMLAAIDFLGHRFDSVIARLGPQVTSLNADSLELLGESYAESGRPDVAVKVFARAIVADPSDPMRYVRFANACLPVKQFAAALETLNAGIKAYPNSAPLYVSRGIVMAELARYDEAGQDLERAQALDPEAAAGAVGLIELQRGEVTKTEADVERSLQQHPNDPMLHYVLAETIVKKGAPADSPEFEKALKSAQKAVAEDPNMGIAHDVLGRLYLQAGQVGDAVKESRTALRLNPHDASATYHLVLALRRAGQTAEIPELLKRLSEMHAQAPALALK